MTLRNRNHDGSMHKRAPDPFKIFYFLSRSFPTLTMIGTKSGVTWSEISRYKESGERYLVAEKCREEKELLNEH